MKKRIGTLKGKPIVEGDKNLVKDVEYKDTNIFDTGYYYKIINKEDFYSVFKTLGPIFSGYGFTKKWVTNLQKNVNIIFSFHNEYYLDYIYISDKSNFVQDDSDGHITSVLKVNNGLQFLIDFFTEAGTEDMITNFKKSFVQITKSEFNKAYHKYEP